jgi:hypothetical protein
MAGSHKTKFVRTPVSKVVSIRERLDQGQSARRIAREEHVSQDTVALVRHGLCNENVADLVEPAVGQIVEPYRCAGCGKLVRYWPCVICRTVGGE